MKQKFKNNKGITLVALVITIIVLLILAMVSIRIVIDGGLIAKASDATKQHKIAKEIEDIDLRYKRYQIEKITNNGYTLEEAFEGMDNVTITEIIGGWKIKINENEYTLKENGEIIRENEVKLEKGSLAKAYEDGILKIGDEVGYVPANGYTYTSPKWNDTSCSDETENRNQTISTDNYETDTEKNSTKWQVLNVNTKTGIVELVATEPLKVKKDTGKSGKYFLSGLDAYEKGITELNKLCATFGHGKGATGARSINVNDINKILNYNPNNYLREYESNGIKFKGKYGYKMVYHGRKTTWNPIETYQIDASKLNDKGEYIRKEPFRNWIYKTYPTDNHPVTVVSNEYTYNRDEVKNVDNKILNMVFGETNRLSYWLASKSTSAYLDSIEWNIFCVYDKTVQSEIMEYSDGSMSADTSMWNIRPVVTLQANVLGEKDASGVWQLK